MKDFRLHHQRVDALLIGFFFFYVVNWFFHLMVNINLGVIINLYLFSKFLGFNPVLFSTFPCRTLIRKEDGIFT